MTIKGEVKSWQKSWAAARGILVDKDGYVSDESENLFLPLSAGFSAALSVAGGGELQNQRDRPAKFRALHSSAALAVNVFQYWEDQAGPQLPAALGFDGQLNDIAIERQFPSGLRGTPPTLDVTVSVEPDHLIAIESKFTEWMMKKQAKLDDFSSKYLSACPGHWDNSNLPNCQRLAAGMASGKELFRHLDVVQLLKHALGLQKNAAGRFSLLYLYYDYKGESDIADLHREEVSKFASIVDSALGFKGLSYQQLFSTLSEQPGISTSYLSYLRERYFPFEQWRVN